jgi:hypothetical protein
MVRTAALILALLAAGCAKQDETDKLRKSYDFAINMGDTDAKCRIAAQAVDVLTDRADNSTEGQLAYITWSTRKNQCALDRLNLRHG